MAKSRDFSLVHRPMDHDFQVIVGERRHVHFVDDVEITGYDYPACLDHTSFDCEDCSFFFEDKRSDKCRLRRCRTERQEIWEEIQPLIAYQKRCMAISSAIQHELAAHGRELHNSVIIKMVMERYPLLEADERLICHALRSMPQMFEQVNPGVYRARTTDQATEV